MSCRYRLIVNPTAKSGKAQTVWDMLRARLNAANVSYEWCLSEYAGHAVVLAYEAAKEQIPFVVAVGGDGTISEVLCGVMRAREEGLGTESALAILYTGTSPDVCRYHQIPLDLNKAVDLLLSERHMLIDVGRVDFFTENLPSVETRAGREKVAYFLCSVNLGVGAAVATGSNTGLRKRFGDFLGTLFSIVGSVARFRPADFSCTLDGKQQLVAKTTNLTVGKNPFIASGLRVNVPIACDDGKLYLFAIRNFSVPRLILNLWRFYVGNFQKHPNNLLTFVDEFSCDYNTDAPDVEFDGDHRGFLPCRVRLVKRSLKLVK